ncbi:hypothetical protein FGO68_gene4716 [Halteria grandinella]|uniref:Dynein heavy chain C-terminal domain-containing protein n=1 Tax=Halteria grandinella TaxID=5974 RepID=A0A8J8NBT5_HALGN|nr:hypothetical protein FGO68_gene4716 [Halteria grandinella]
MPVIHFLPKAIQDKSTQQTDPKKRKAVKKSGSSENPSSSDSDNDDEDEQTKQQYSRKYKCPVYKTSVRAGTLSTTGQSTNYILAIDLTMGQMGMQEHWALRGTALITMLND